MPATRRTRWSEAARAHGEPQSLVYGLATDTEGPRSDVKESRKGASSWYIDHRLLRPGGDELNPVVRKMQTAVPARDTSKGRLSICSDDDLAVGHTEGKQGCKLNSAQGTEKKRPQHGRRKGPITQPTPAAGCFPSSTPATNTDSSTPSSERLIPMTRSRTAHLEAVDSKNAGSRDADRRGPPARKASNPVCDADFQGPMSSTSLPSLYTTPISSKSSSPEPQSGSPWHGSRPIPPRAQLLAVDDTQPKLCPVPKVSRPTTKLRSSAPRPAAECDQAIVPRSTIMVANAAVARKTAGECFPSGDQEDDGLLALQALHGHVSASQGLQSLAPTTSGYITSASAPVCVQPGAYSYRIDIPPPTPCTPLDRSLIVPTLSVYNLGLGFPPFQPYGPLVHDTEYSDIWTARQDSLLPTASPAPRFVPYIPYTPPPDTPLIPALARASAPQATGGWYRAHDRAPSPEGAVGNGDWANAWAAEYLFGAAVSPSASTATMLPPPLQSQFSNEEPLCST